MHIKYTIIPLRSLLILVLILSSHFIAGAQGRREDIYAASVLYQNRMALQKDLQERIIGRNMTLPLDSNSEDKYLSACDAISQFLFYSPVVNQGFRTLFTGYDSLSYDTRRSFLEAVYAVGAKHYTVSMLKILDKETNPKLFAICAAYLYRADTGTENCNSLKIKMVEKFPAYDSLPILVELESYLSYHGAYRHTRTPGLSNLFSYQRQLGHKVIYSLQRWNRDYPGLAIVQDENGQFMRTADGRLQVFEQLARSGSDLPYFITDGSTPQGIFSIQGTGESRSSFIGPTPNFQLVMPFEGPWSKYFHADTTGAAAGDLSVNGKLTGYGNGGTDSLNDYLSLLPSEWQHYMPMREAWSAGKIGRTEIIAHGTTIDPEYFRDKPFYPLTPTMGCLCAREEWNPTTGHLLMSEQYGLISAFVSTPGKQGYLYVINIDDQQKPVSRPEVEAIVKAWESSQRN